MTYYGAVLPPCTAPAERYRSANIQAGRRQPSWWGEVLSTVGIRYTCFTGHIFKDKVMEQHFVTSDGLMRGYRVVIGCDGPEDQEDHFVVEFPEKRNGRHFSAEKFANKDDAWAFARKDFFTQFPDFIVPSI
jgi:hypothetical protein